MARRLRVAEGKVILAWRDSKEEYVGEAILSTWRKDRKIRAIPPPFP